MVLGRNNQSSAETIRTVIGYVWNVVDYACLDVICLWTWIQFLIYLFKDMENANFIVYLLLHLYSCYSIIEILPTFITIVQKNLIWVLVEVFVLKYSKLKKVVFRKYPAQASNPQSLFWKNHIKHAFWVNVRAQKLILTSLKSKRSFGQKIIKNKICVKNRWHGSCTVWKQITY